MENIFFTDLATESRMLHQRAKSADLPGVRAVREKSRGFSLDRVEIGTEEAAEALGKPVGRYVTVELDPLSDREEGAFDRGCAVLAEELSRQLSLGEEDAVLVAGLGNEAITPDALGPMTGEYLLVTRHLKEKLPEDFAAFRSVAFFPAGVLGTTGVESGELICRVAEAVRPAAVIAVDALCARETRRLCRAVQIADSGIVPGSGVGNARMALTRETLGVPVISVGVPTVVDARTLCQDLSGSPGEGLRQGELFVTPRDIDARVRQCARLVGCGIDLALHPGLTPEDVQTLLE